jgi:hypothetical protein
MEYLLRRHNIYRDPTVTRLDKFRILDVERKLVATKQD